MFPLLSWRCGHSPLDNKKKSKSTLPHAGSWTIRGTRDETGIWEGPCVPPLNTRQQAGGQSLCRNWIRSSSQAPTCTCMNKKHTFMLHAVIATRTVRSSSISHEGEGTQTHTLSFSLSLAASTMCVHKTRRVELKGEQGKKNTHIHTHTFLEV